MSKLQADQLPSEPIGSRSRPGRGGSGGRTGPRLGTTDDLLTPPVSDRGKRQGSRISVYAMKAVQRQFTGATASRFCGYPKGSTVPITVSRELVAHVGGIQRCGSSWACPPCARAVRRERGQEIELATAFHKASGGSIFLVTLTLPHQVSDDLKTRLEVVCGALGSCLQGQGWNRRRLRMAYRGSIRSVEITYGDVHGWHPHVHVLFFFDRRIGVAQADDFGSWLYGRWNGLCEHRGFGSVNREKGFDLVEVDATERLSAYMAKSEEDWHIGHEMARGDLKVGRSTGMTPFELLGQFMETGEVRYLMLWREFEVATFGRRSIFWSHGLRDQLVPTPERSDQEAAAAEGLGGGELVKALEDGERFWRELKAGRLGYRLRDIEDVAAVLWFMTMWRGGPSGQQTASEQSGTGEALDAGRPGRAGGVADAGLGSGTGGGELRRPSVPSGRASPSGGAHSHTAGPSRGAGRGRGASAGRGGAADGGGGVRLAPSGPVGGLATGV